MDIRRLLPALVAATLVAVVATTAVVLLRGRSEPRRDATGEPAVAAAVIRAGEAREARAVLAGWDERRARAWAAGDAVALRGLYTGRSTAGRRDREMLRAYAGRGLRVEGLRTQVLAVELLESDAERIVLRVTDRVVGARAVPVTGGVGVALPDDRPSTREIEMVLPEGASRWRVASVTAQPRASPAASTAVTSWSRKP